MSTGQKRRPDGLNKSAPKSFGWQKKGKSIPSTMTVALVLIHFDIRIVHVQQLQALWPAMAVLTLIVIAITNEWYASPWLVVSFRRSNLRAALTVSGILSYEEKKEIYLLAVVDFASYIFYSFLLLKERQSRTLDRLEEKNKKTYWILSVWPALLRRFRAIGVIIGRSSVDCLFIIGRNGLYDSLCLLLLRVVDYKRPWLDRQPPKFFLVMFYCSPCVC